MTVTPYVPYTPSPTVTVVGLSGSSWFSRLHPDDITKIAEQVVEMLLKRMGPGTEEA